jgi:hypothetical protein
MEMLSMVVVFLFAKFTRKRRVWFFVVRFFVEMGKVLACGHGLVRVC